MPTNPKHEATVKNLTKKQARTTGQKAPGTRLGVLIDWRLASANSGKLSDRYGRSLRDGE